MAYVMEIQVAEDNLTERMSRMRTWLDQQGFEPSSFRFSDGGVLPRVCRVNFKSEREATAFAKEFGGHLLRAPSTDTAML